MKIESRDRTVKDLLSSGYYVIPRFQRPYSWDIENISDFWADVAENQSEYFIGSMVVYQLLGRLGVVDGQQRLTTIMILLASLRDTLEKNGFSDQASGLHKLIERENIENKLEFVLNTQTSYPFLQDNVLSAKSQSIPAKVGIEEESIKAARIHFNRKLNELVDEIENNEAIPKAKKQSRKKERLLQLRESVLSLNVILITLDSEEDAYLIFETLNTRGKDLALADLVKNHLAKHLKTKNQSLDGLSLKWTKMRETIEGKRELDTDTFLYHWWLSKYEYTAQKNIYKEFRRKIGKANALATLDELSSAADQYRAINDPPFANWEKQRAQARSSLEALNLFRVRQQMPLSVALLRAYESKHLNLSQFSGALQQVERFHFLFTAITSQRSSGGISWMYANLARRLYEAGNAQTEVAAILKELKAKLRERIPTEAQFLASFPSLIYTSTISKDRSLVRYVLNNVSKHLKIPHTDDLNDLTIEHLVPQSAIGSGPWTEETVGEIGNLMLITSSVNQKLENKDYASKKQILKRQYKSALPEHFWSADELTPELIRQRTDEMAKLAYSQVWKL